MALLDGYHTKMRPDLPYMTTGEANHFKRTEPHMSFYRKGPCKQCGKDVPKSKDYCSKKCYERAEKDGDAG